VEVRAEVAGGVFRRLTGFAGVAGEFGFEENFEVLRGGRGSAREGDGRLDGMVDLAGGDKRRDVRRGHFGSQIPEGSGDKCVVPFVLQANRRDGLEVIRQFSVNFRADRVCAVGAFFMDAHGHNTARIDGHVRDADFTGNAVVVRGGDEGRVIVRDDAEGLFGEAVQEVVRAFLLGAEVEKIAGVEALQRVRDFRDSFEHEGVNAVVSGGVGAGQPFVDEERKVVPIGEIGGVGEGMVEGDAPVHLRPVEDVMGVGAEGGVVEGADSVFDVLRMPHAGVRVE